MKPVFSLIAGPNGSGKSTFGPTINPNSIYYNGDLIYSNFIKENPTYTDADIYDMVLNHYDELKDTVIDKKLNFSLETPFNDQFPTSEPAFFKSKGFKVELIIFTLGSEYASSLRVANRVKFGGHNVDNKTISSNFKNGIKKMNLHFKKFDTVILYDNHPINDVRRFPKKILEIKDNKVEFLANKITPYIEKHFKDIIDYCKYLQLQHNKNRGMSI